MQFLRDEVMHQLSEYILLNLECKGHLVHVVL